MKEVELRDQLRRLNDLDCSECNTRYLAYQGLVLIYEPTGEKIEDWASTLQERLVITYLLDNLTKLYTRESREEEL